MYTGAAASARGGALSGESDIAWLAMKNSLECRLGIGEKLALIKLPVPVVAFSGISSNDGGEGFDEVA